jgi:choice-of-anchor B domain-containing protein
MRYAFCLIAATLSHASLAQAQFQARGVDLLSNVPLSGFGNPPPGAGNDCWGYVSGSGREYAIIGLQDRAAFVEVTNPSAPVILNTTPHTSSTWGDVKVYGTYAYFVNDTGGGLQVFNLANIDAGQVSLVRTVTANGLTHSHNVALNTASGYLYLCGSNVSGSGGALVAYSLLDPSNPVQAGIWTQGAHYVHDAQIVTYTSGPYAGREIAFCSDEEAGIAVVDVTNKSAMTTLATRTYPGVSYCHQCWLSADRRYLYVDDETDGPAQGVARSFTRIFNVTDITNPVYVGGFASGASDSTDHNLYVRDQYIYEANYHSGLRVFDASNPTAPTEVAFLDTYPEDDNGGYAGAWSNFPFFPSGTILVSDINRGLFVARLNLNYLTISFVGGAPSQVQPSMPTPVTVSITNVGAPLDPSSVTLYARVGSGSFTAIAMTSIGGDQFRASLPGAPCLSTIDYYVSAANTQGRVSTSPLAAPSSFNSAQVFAGTSTLLNFDMETAAGWTGGVAGDTATTGAWERGDPEPTAAQPGDDHTPAPGVNCWVTGRTAGTGVGANDVDGGRTTLLSPVMNLANVPSATMIGYWRWYSNDQGAAPNADVFVVDISNNGGSSWTNVETVGPAGAGTSGGWTYHEFRAADIVPLTSNMRLRFIADDAGSGSVIEAAVDDLRVFAIECGPTCGTSDFNGDGDVGTDADIEAFFACLAGNCCPTCFAGGADFNGDGDVGTDADIEAFFRVLAGGPC